MKESLRRVILFAVIVITGSVMILFDVPLILMIPLILAVGFVILLLLGAITIADFKSVFTRKKLKNPKKISLIQRLDGMKFFEKKSAPPDKKPPSPAKSAGTPKSGHKMPETKPVRFPICVYCSPHSVRCEQFSKSAANMQKKWSTLTSCSIKQSVRR